MLCSDSFDAKAEMMRLLYAITQSREPLSFVAIGSHGYYRSNLSQAPPEGVANKMQRSKQFPENMVNKPINSFAFPYGSNTRDTVAEAKKTSYSQLLVMDFHYKDDHQGTAVKERFTVNPFVSAANQTYATVNRSYER